MCVSACVSNEPRGVLSFCQEIRMVGVSLFRCATTVVEGGEAGLPLMTDIFIKSSVC